MSRPYASELAPLACGREVVQNRLRPFAATPESALAEPRGMGRANLPSDVLGSIVHAARTLDQIATATQHHPGTER